MSGHSYDSVCPNCGEPMNTCYDYKPFERISSECLHCGFYLEPKIGQMTLKDLNYQRKNYNEGQDLTRGDRDYLPRLKKLPECNLDEIFNS